MQGFRLQPRAMLLSNDFKYNALWTQSDSYLEIPLSLFNCTVAIVFMDTKKWDHYCYLDKAIESYHEIMELFWF